MQLIIQTLYALWQLTTGVKTFAIEDIFVALLQWTIDNFCMHLLQLTTFVETIEIEHIFVALLQ